MALSLAEATIDKIDWLLVKAYPVISGIGMAQPTPHEAPAVLPKVESSASGGARESLYQMTGLRSCAAAS